LSRALPFRHCPIDSNLFKVLVAANPDSDSRAPCWVERMPRFPDPRAADPIWGLTSGEHFGGGIESYGMLAALQKVHFGGGGP